MPDGPVHALATIAMATGVGVALAIVSPTPDWIVMAELGFVYTLAVNPDLDLQKRFPSHPSRWLWWVYWWPYMKLVKHRSAISHMPILGSAIRILYILPIVLLFWWLGVRPPLDYRLVWFVLAVVISDTVHAILDYTTTFIKRRT